MLLPVLPLITNVTAVFILLLWKEKFSYLSTGILRKKVFFFFLKKTSRTSRGKYGPTPTATEKGCFVNCIYKFCSSISLPIASSLGWCGCHIYSKLMLKLSNFRSKLYINVKVLLNLRGLLFKKRVKMPVKAI